MQTIRVDLIEVPENRIRKAFDIEQLDELRASIISKGLMQPIVLRNDGKTLVAGERRLRAIKMMHKLNESFYCDGNPVDVDHVPFVLLSDLSEHDYLEAELEENAARVDLSWQETTHALAQLDKFKKEQNHEWTTSDTAEAVFGTRGGSYNQKVSDAVAISKHMADPEVAKCKTKKEALTVVKRKNEIFNRKILAETVGGGVKSQHELIIGDCLGELAELEPHQFDVIITDPPYGVDADKFNEQATIKHTYKDDKESFIHLVDVIALEGSRITKDKAHLYMFCDFRNFHYIASIFTACNWDVMPWPLIWYKGSSGMLPKPDHWPRKSYECILYAIKGNKPVESRAALDVINIPHEENRLHSAQKPVELYVNLLRRSCLTGDKIIDPFCGTGTVFKACTKLDLVAMGIELDPETAAIAKSNM